MACFSNSYENEYLWRKYADKHKGFVLAFDKDYIPTETVTTASPGGRCTEVRMDKMHYGDEEFVKEVINWDQPGATLVFVIDAYKEEIFRKEQEQRLLAYCPPPHELHMLHYDPEVINKKKFQ